MGAIAELGKVCDKNKLKTGANAVAYEATFRFSNRSQTVYNTNETILIFFRNIPSVQALRVKLFVRRR